MEMRLAHGRNDPDEEVDGWGFEGPTLTRVDSMQQMYGETYTIRFLTNEAASDAQQLTGWKTWDSQTLEMSRHGDLIEAHEPDRIPSYYADLFIFHRNALSDVTDAAAHARRASRALNDAISSLRRKF